MFQTRSEETGLGQHKTLAAAMKESIKDKTIWKISFSIGNERIRLVKQNNEWILTPIELNNRR